MPRRHIKSNKQDDNSYSNGVNSNVEIKHKGSTNGSKQNLKQNTNILPMLKGNNTKAGSVYVCGTGDVAQLGLGEDVMEAKVPTKLNILGNDIISLAVGGIHNLVYSWGCNDQKCLGRDGDEYIPEKIDSFDGLSVVYLVCGDSISAALTIEGKVYTWGTFRNSTGILGYSSKVNVQEKPKLVDFKEKGVIITKIVAGTDHIIALTDKAKVYTWGNGEQLLLGRKVLQRHKYDSLIPERLAIENIVDISSGSYHSFALSNNNIVYCWGLNNFGQLTSLFAHSIVPETYDFVTRINTLEHINVKQIEAGEHFTLILSKEGYVYSVGRCDNSQLGLSKQLIENNGIRGDSNQIKAITVPTLVEGLNGIIRIACGTTHSLALRNDGVVYSWGFGETYALGHGDSKDQPIPKIIERISRPVIDIKCGAQHSVFLVE